MISEQLQIGYRGQAKHNLSCCF